MIEWERSGFYGDEGMPDVRQSVVPIFGTRTSGVVDLAECLAKLGVIRSGWVVWISDEPEDTAIEVDISIDGGETFRQVRQREVIPDFHSDMQLVVRERLRSQMTEIQPDLSPVLRVLVVYLSSKGALVWDKEPLPRLEWLEG